MNQYTYDVFISHASEDKDSFVRPLAENLIRTGLKVWYDEFSLKLGDSIRNSIDKGLAKSKYGIVVLSLDFFRKRFPQQELNALFSKAMAGEENTILPIWHGINKEFLLDQAPMLADVYSLTSDMAMSLVVQKILEVVKPESAYLLEDGLEVSVTPQKVRLHIGGWRVVTPITVTNHTKQPLYDVYLKISVPTNDVPTESIEHQTSKGLVSYYGNVGPIKVNYDLIRYDLLDEHGNGFIYIRFHKIDPMSSRDILIKGGNQKDREATFKIVSFSLEAVELLESENSIGHKFNVFETATLKSMNIFMSK